MENRIKDIQEALVVIQITTMQQLRLPVPPEMVERAKLIDLERARATAIREITECVTASNQ